MHPQPRARVDLDHDPGLSPAVTGRATQHRCRDVGQPHVDAADVQADHGRGPAAHFGDVLVHQVGHVAAGSTGGQVRVPTQGHEPAAGRDRRRAQALGLQVRERVLVEFDLGQLSGVSLAPARVGIRHIDEPGDVGGTIAGHRGRPQLGRGHHRGRAAVSRSAKPGYSVVFRPVSSSSSSRATVTGRVLNELGPLR
ncbi:hypothetical protein [Microbispora triticiradicis]|uniref:hypothetical protein n=1 Tax=Microbispora triticiradicis TaxID=2200763 RepID=UPI001AD7C9F5|nr:hypothetical protein [Microbispora triticiradicis]MBO4270418.1 hypothetical protein [Microbispora triticiradicis]